jgi:hypothetical protein
MESNKKVDPENDLFVRHAKEIKPAYDRAVREALLKHKLAGNPVPIERNGKMVVLQPDEIKIT